MTPRAGIAAILLSAGLVTTGAWARADCIARVDGQDIVIAEDAVVPDQGPGLRERVLTWPGRTWDRARGTPSQCDSARTIAFLSGIEGLDATQADGLCLAPLPDDDGYLLVPGERNFRGLCRRTACDRVNLATADATAAAGAITGLVTGMSPRPDGITGLFHGSGAMLLRGDGGLLGQALGAAGETLGPLLATPAGAITLLTVGGVVFYCRD